MNRPNSSGRRPIEQIESVRVFEWRPGIPGAEVTYRDGAQESGPIKRFSPAYRRLIMKLRSPPARA
jgi:hypothetical protein